MEAIGRNNLYNAGNPKAPRSGGTFRALRNRDFALLWAGLTISAVGTWMQIVAQSLLVLELTHGSAIALGAIALMQAMAFLLFAPAGGSFADRHDKRKILLTTQSLMMGLAILLGTVTASGRIRFWMIPLTAFATGAALSYDQPARGALVAALVPADELMNAVSLQSAVFNGASLLGPVLAGFALSAIGYAGNFFLNAASYSAVLAALIFVRDPEAHGIKKMGSGLLDSVREILGRVRRDPVLPSLLSAYAALLFCGPSVALMAPLFARQILHADPSRLGILFAASGCGTVTSALIVASLGDFTHKVRLLFGAILLWTMALAAFAASAGLHQALPALFVLGAAQNAAGSTAVTLLQTRVPPRMRGRAMSLNTLLIMFVRPLGDFPVAAVIARLGFEHALFMSAAIVAVATLAASFAARSPKETLPMSQNPPLRK
jgi:predicted MFS family arabinose efflux permease